MTYKDIPGFEGLYSVSEDGHVYSHRIARELKPVLYNNGYYYVCLSYKGKQTRIGVHRLVAMTYIPNPNKKTQVNHIDENRTNNKVKNLEWVSCKENINRGSHNIRSAKNRHKPVRCVETGRVFDGVKTAAKFIGVVRTALSNVLHGNSRTCAGYHWEFC